MDFNRYFKNNELEDILNKWAQQYPDFFTLLQFGTSYESRPIWLVKLTNHATGSDTDKPAVWVDANIHATEIAGTTTALNIIHNLLSNYGKDPRCTRLLDKSVYYVVPRLNPDGAALALAEKPAYIRSGTRPYPWEQMDDGLHVEDIDGDKRILQMRIADPNGDWKISSLEPRLLEKRQPDDHGEAYFRLLPEGSLENYDGYVIKIARPLQSLDFNRNFPFQWRPEGEQSGAGPYPASENEIRAAIEFIVNHPNINIAVSLHTFSRVILRPFSTKSDDEMPTHDLWVYQKMSEIGTRLTGFRAASTFHDFKYHPKEVTTGAFDDWMYDQLGAYAFTIELWDLPTEAGIKDRKFIEWFREHDHSEDQLILNWIETNAPDGYVPWYKFDHPQLGPVELGGWDAMYTWRNPPPQFMGAESNRAAHFGLALGDLLPHLVAQTLTVTPLGQGDYHINLVVENTGFLPTFTSEMAKNRSAIRPVRVELDLPPGVKLQNGKKRGELGHLEGRSNKLDVLMLWSNSPTDNRAHVEWVVSATAGTDLPIHVRSERAGTLHLTARLE